MLSPIDITLENQDESSKKASELTSETAVNTCILINSLDESEKGRTDKLSKDSVGIIAGNEEH